MSSLADVSLVARSSQLRWAASRSVLFASWLHPCIGARTRCSSRQRIQPAGVPALPGSERDLEGDPAVRILRRRIAVREPKDQLALEVTVQVAGLELVPCSAPFLHDVTSANEPVLAHLEEIGEIAPHGDLEIERDRLEPMVGQVEVFVQLRRLPRGP